MRRLKENTVAANEKEIAPIIGTGWAKKAPVAVCRATGPTVMPKDHSRFSGSAR